MNRTSSILLNDEGAAAPRREHGAPDVVALDSAAQTWSAFSAPSSDQVFCQAWLALQCGAIAHVRAGLLLLREEADQSYVPAAVWPDARKDLTYLTNAAERAISQRRGTVLGLNPDDAQNVATGTLHVAYPVESDDELIGAVVLDLRARSETELQAVLRQLLWGAGWLVALLRKHRLAREAHVRARAATALGLVQAAQAHRTLEQAAMAVVNELATSGHADRVSLGIEKKGKLKLRAMSRTAWFDRKSQWVEMIENAMEEVLDQQVGIAYPAGANARAKVNVAQRDLAQRSGAKAVLSVPLMSGGHPIGALTLERETGEPFDAESMALCEAAGELLGPVFDTLLDHERWFAGRLVDAVANGRDKLLGPRRPTLKISALLLLIAVVFLTFAQAPFRIAARTVVEGEVQRAAVAPFDGYIAQAFVRAGDTVRQGAVLATLDDRDLKLEQVRWQAEKEQATRRHSEALAKRERASTGILAAQLAQAEAQLSLAEDKLARTQLIAPFDAAVVAGDLSQTLGAPVEKGKVLFELAPLDSYRVVLKVDERDISYMKVGQHGELGLTGITGDTLPFTVKRITSVSTPQEGRNYFRVEAQLADASTRLRPGMEGVGKVSVSEERVVWIWTRNFVNWLRLALWSWLP